MLVIHRTLYWQASLATFISWHTTGDKKHDPSKLNYYTFGDELTPLDVNSLSSAQQMDVVYTNWPLKMRNSQLRIRFNRMSLPAYSNSLSHRKHETSKLNYQTFSDELTPPDIHSLSSPQQLDVVYKIDHSKQKTLNSVSDLTGMSFTAH